jgi:hypothetical protein
MDNVKNLMKNCSGTYGKSKEILQSTAYLNDEILNETYDPPADH